MSDFEQEKLMYEGKRELVEETEKFLKDAFQDIKESAKAQHEVDKANFEAAKAEAKARHEAAVNAGKTASTHVNEKVQKDIEAIKEKTAAQINALKHDK